MTTKIFILIIFISLLLVAVGLRAEIAHNRTHRFIAKQSYITACVHQGESIRECSNKATMYAKGLK